MTRYTDDLMKEWLENLPSRLANPDLAHTALQQLWSTLPYNIRSLLPVSSHALQIGLSPLVTEEDDRTLAVWITYPTSAELAHEVNRNQLAFLVKAVERITGIREVVLRGSDGAWDVQRSEEANKFVMWRL